MCVRFRCSVRLILIVRSQVRPKCWYCRQGKPCPHVTCTGCTNRIVVPKKYAPSAKELKSYKCPACTTAKRPTRETVETCARDLVAENGVRWLGVSELDDARFKGYSAFKIYKAHGAAAFAPAAPSLREPIALRLRSKDVLDAPDVVKQLDGRVGRGEVARRACALCFDDFAPDKVGPACGRSGCAQRVCGGCLREWYGKNAPGTLLNPMELACPFCRRVPVAKIILRVNPEVGGLKGAFSLCTAASFGDADKSAGVQDALGDRAWFYAWCGQCSTARRCVERQCTAEGRLPAVTGFVCEPCEEEAAREAQRLEDEQRELAALVERMERNERREEAEQRLHELRAAKKETRRRFVTKLCPNANCGATVEKVRLCSRRCSAHWLTGCALV